MDTSLHYTSVNHATCLMSTINRLRCGGQLCDVIITAGNVKISAHRLVLAASSPYFKPLLDTPHTAPLNGMPLEIRLDDLDADSMEQIVEFCYTSSICVNEENVWTLLPTAARLQISELCTLCSDFLQSTLNPDTSMQTYMVAVRSGLTDLSKEVLKVLKRDLDKVLESDGFLEMVVEDMSEVLQSLPPAVLGHRDKLKAIRLWVQHRHDTRQCYAAQLAHSFPGLLSRLKEFLPEELLLQPVETDSLPSSPSGPTPRVSPASLRQVSPLTLDIRPHLSPVGAHNHHDAADSDADLKGLDLSMGSSFLREDASDSMPSDSTDSPSTSPLCLVCGEIFHTPTLLRQHQDDCTQMLFRESGETLDNGFPSSPADLSDSRNDEGGGVGKRGADQHVCQLCFKVFSDKKSLGKHMRTHSQSGFSCTMCEKRYSTRSHLLGHMRLHSGSHPPFPCEYCQHPFSTYCALKVHMRGHKGARPFSCPTCGQHFAKNIHLKRHLSTHTGIKPHECDMCGKHFSRSDHLKRHVQSIHAGQRPHACHLCSKAFVRKYELNKHLQYHAPAPSGPILAEASWDGRPFFGMGSQGLALAIPDGILPTERMEGR